MRRAVRELIHTVADRRSKRSVYDPRGYVPVIAASTTAPSNKSKNNDNDSSLAVDEEMVSILARHAADDEAADSLTGHVADKMEKADYGSMTGGEKSNGDANAESEPISQYGVAGIVQQVSAVAVVALLNMMMTIPFGASYFPIGWKSAGEKEGASDDGDDENDGFFPNHVLVGCIGGIGVFMVCTAMEITTDTTFDINNPRTAIQITIVDRWYLLWVIVAFEVSLRLLINCTKDPITGQPRFQLLSPIFYILITPIF